MLAEIGLVATFLAFAAAIYAIIASLYGERFAHSEALVLSGRNAVLLTFVFMLVAIGSLATALMTQQYQIAYVWSVSSPEMPNFFRFTALWGSQAGSLLFWTFLMSAFAAAAVLLNWKSHRRLMPYAIVYMMAVEVFFLALVLFFENPFARWWIIPTNPADAQVVQAGLIPLGAVAPEYDQPAKFGAGLEPAAAPLRYGNPPADALSRLRFVHYPLRLCDGRAGFGRSFDQLD